MSNTPISGAVTFYGQICNEAKKGLAGLTISLYEKIPNGQKTLGAMASTENGHYAFEMAVSDQMRVYYIDVRGNLGEQLAESDYIFKANSKNEINLLVSHVDYQEAPLLDRCKKLFTAYPKENVAEIRFGEQTESEIRYMAGLLSVQEHVVRTFLKSLSLAAEYDLPDYVFFAWGLLGVELSVPWICVQNPAYLKELIRQAEDRHFIAFESQEALVDLSVKIDRFFAERALTESINGVSLQDNISFVMDDSNAQKEIFINYIAGCIDIAGDQVGPNTGSAADTDQLKLLLKLSALSSNRLIVTKLLFEIAKANASPDPVKLFARWTKSKWITIVEGCLKAENSSFEQDQSNVVKYVSSIIEMLRLSYPTDIFFAEISEQSNLPLTKILASEIVAFLADNPDFKFEQPLLLEEANRLKFQKNTDKKALLSMIWSIQRLFRHTKHYDQIDKLLANGVNSSFAIAQYAREDFVNNFQNCFGGKNLVEEIFNDARYVYNHSLMIWSKYDRTINASTYAIGNPIFSDAKDVTLRSLFGHLEWTDYPYCTSVFSPAAYYADTLNFLNNQSGLLIAEITRRRPDLLTIKLNCKNSETRLPYIDLVNEVLERMVLAGKTPPVIPPPNQTTWNEFELSVSPENLNYDAYEELKSAVFPIQLPFDFPLEETRIFLKQLQQPRDHVMMVFFPSQSYLDAFNSYEIGLEKLALSLGDGDIITGKTLGSGGANNGLWNFYGFDKPSSFKPIVDPANSQTPIEQGVWNDVLSGRVDIFLQQTNLNYKELLGMLMTDFINPDTRVNKIQIVAKKLDSSGSPVPPDTTDLSLLELQGITMADFSNFHRFIRLAKKIKWSIYDLDKAIKALGPYPVAERDWRYFLVKIAQLKQLRNQLTLPIDELLAFWADIGTKNYTDYNQSTYPLIPSLYDKLFQDRSVITAEVFDAPLANALSASAVAAALQISLKQLNYLVGVLGLPAPWSLTNLSLLFRHVQLSKLINLDIANFIKAKQLIGIDPFLMPSTTFDFLSKFKGLDKSFFNYHEVNYLLAHELEVSMEIIPHDDLISLFLSELRAALRASFASETLTSQQQDDELRNLARIVTQKFSEKLKLTYLSTAALLIDHKSTGSPGYLVDIFLTDDPTSENNSFLKNYVNAAKQEFEPVFVRKKSSKNDMEIELPALFDAFILLDKIALIINTMKFSDVDLVHALENYTSFGSLSLLDLPVSPIGHPDVEGFLVLEGLFKTKSQLPADRPALFDILTATDKAQWISVLCFSTDWDQNKVELLIGDSQTLLNAGWLHTNYPTDFKTGDLIGRISLCMKSFATLGNDTNIVKSLTSPNISSSLSQTIKDIIKSAYNEVEWINIIKPLRDELREMQRAALVAFIINQADPLKFQNWTNTNQLYEYLLIDVEMQPVTQTSRIRQAICSLQLLVDRVLLNVEYVNGDSSGRRIQLGVENIAQWKQWRSMYRVWEAGRKIFLYPENWLEPELRDDKSFAFTEMETELRQNELNTINLQNSFLNYLSKLEDTSRLQIIGTFFQNEPKTYDPDTQVERPAIQMLHVFGRSMTTPYAYFYRTFNQKEWSTWAKMEVDLDSQHAFPILYGRRLGFFWLLFIEQHDQQDSLSPDAPVSTPDGYWKIQVAWTSFQNGSWTSKRISKNWFESKRFSAGGPSIKAQMDAFKDALISFHGSDDDKFFIQANSHISYDADFVVPDCAGTAYGVNISFRDFFHDPEINCISSPGGPYGTTLLDTTIPKETRLFGIPDTLNQYKLYKETDVILNGSNNRYALTVPWEIQGDWTPQGNDFFFQDSKNTFWIRYTNLINTSIFTDERVTIANWRRALKKAENTGGRDNRAGANWLLTQDPTSRFTFSTFYQPNAKSFIQTLSRFGLATLLSRSQQVVQNDTIDFANVYRPTALVSAQQLPDSRIDFSNLGAYSKYNWELFFYTPLLIANRLSTDQQFEAARTWYHYIFDPTRPGSGGQERFWHFQPFYELSQKPLTTLDDILRDSTELGKELGAWMENPYQPHVIARIRLIAYMKNVLMKYLDNLIAWADTLYRADNIEDINQATNLYVLAEKILGPRPQPIPARVTHSDKSFNDLKGSLDQFSNVLVDIETFIPPSATHTGTIGAVDSIGKMFYFSIPANEKLFNYWDVIADRLFKIRHGQNIAGVNRTLSLYGSPIDPALLVKANALGMDLNSILTSFQANLSPYRFKFMLQLLKELIAELKEFGRAFLTALEKRDEAALQLLASAHGQKLLQAILQVKQSQIEQDTVFVDSAANALEIAQISETYYSSREFTNAYEKQYLDSIQKGITLSIIQGGVNVAASALAAIPNFKIGAPTSVGATFGGENLSSIMMAISNNLGILASINSAQGNMALTLGSYNRRMDDWSFQASLAAKQVEQMKKQHLAAQIRLSLSQSELSNHQLQIQNASEEEQFMRSRFTNQELYDWQVDQLSTLYFQSYQLTYDFAKKVEKCFQFETGQFEKSYIKFGYWDTLKKGLLSAEKMQYDLRRIETAFLEQDTRDFELSKYISLAFLAPQAVVDLIQKGTANFIIPEELFDLDYPGHYYRRIKSIAITIPCVTGPYTTINCTLMQNSSFIRINQDIGLGYPATSYDDGRFYAVKERVGTVIATSNAQNDNGLFENTLAGDRYLPFEGAGVFGSYTVSLHTAMELRPFDYQTITDIVLKFDYTAKNATINGFKTTVENYLKDLLVNTFPSSSTKSGMELWRLISIRHEFPNEWYQFLHPNLGTPAILSFVVTKDRFPYLVHNRTLMIRAISFQCPNSAIDPNTLFDFKLNNTPFTSDMPLEAGAFTLLVKTGVQVDEATLQDLFFILDYHLK